MHFNWVCMTKYNTNNQGLNVVIKVSLCRLSFSFLIITGASLNKLISYWLKNISETFSKRNMTKQKLCFWKLLYECVSFIMNAFMLLLLLSSYNCYACCHSLQFGPCSILRWCYRVMYTVFLSYRFCTVNY